LIGEGKKTIVNRKGVNHPADVRKKELGCVETGFKSGLVKSGDHFVGGSTEQGKYNQKKRGRELS